MILYKIIAVPIVVCGSETQFLKKNHETRKQTAEMTFLCRVVEYTRTNQQSNSEIRKKLEAFSLNIEIQNYRSNWLQNSQYHTQGKRSLG